MTDTEHQPLTIGEIARRSGKHASAIRYYESIGLLPEPARASGRRTYDASTLRTVAIVDTAQRGGLSLAEIKLLLAASPDDDSAIERLRDLAERKLPEISAQLERTRMVQGWLQAAANCTCPTLDDCPLFDDERECAPPAGPTAQRY